MCVLFTLLGYSHLFNVYCGHQVMRKKTATVSTSATVSTTNKLIAKPSRTSKSSTRPITNGSTNHVPKEHEQCDIQHGIPLVGATSPTKRPESHGLGSFDEDVISNSGSRDRSTTPLESGFLRYLTAHISPPNVDDANDLCVAVTTFVIGRDEYLQGIVRLVKRDCPEVAHDMQGFLDAMKHAFVDSTDTSDTSFEL